MSCVYWIYPTQKKTFNKLKNFCMIAVILIVSHIEFHNVNTELLFIF